MVSGGEGQLQVKSSVNYTCSSDLSVLSIQWLNNSDNGTVLYNNSGQQELVLPIAEVTRSLHNTTLTCKLEVLLATGDIKLLQATIIVQVLGKNQETKKPMNSCTFICRWSNIRKQ